MRLRPLTVGIVVTRKDMAKAAIASAENQVYNGKLWIQLLDNTNYGLSIGEAFNKIADTAKGEWILYLGDDDIITPDYCSSLMTALVYPPDNKTVCITSNSTYFNTTEQSRKDTIPTGIWKKSYIREHRFDEIRKNQVDTEFYRRADKDKSISRIFVDWHYGYFYRQHGGNVSGSKKI